VNIKQGSRHAAGVFFRKIPAGAPGLFTLFLLRALARMESSGVNNKKGFAQPHVLIHHYARFISDWQIN
jgi:hypothetical protein